MTRTETPAPGPRLWDADVECSRHGPQAPEHKALVGDGALGAFRCGYSGPQPMVLGAADAGWPMIPQQPLTGTGLCTRLSECGNFSDFWEICGSFETFGLMTCNPPPPIVIFLRIFKNCRKL